MHLVNKNYWFLILLIQLILISIIVGSYFIKNNTIINIFSENQQKIILSNINYSFKKIRLIFLILSILLLGLTTLDPRWGTKNSIREIEGIDLVIIIDISKSMLTKDVYPDRINYSKKLASYLINLLNDNRIGLTAFAGYGFNIIPLTTDFNAINIILNELNTEIIDVQGSNLEDGIKKAIELFEKEALTHKAIVLFSDGEDNEFNPIKQANIASKKGIYIFTVGIGTIKGDMIPIYDDNGKIIDYVKYNGKAIYSKLNEDLLKRISYLTKVEYFYGDEKNILKLANKINEIKKSKLINNPFDLTEPKYHYFLLISIILIILYMFLPERKLFLKFVFLFIIFPIFTNSSYGSLESKATKEYFKKNYENALKLFQKSILFNKKNEKLLFNEANCYYRLKLFNDAINKYVILTNSSNKDIKYKSIFNLANSFFYNNNYEQALNTLLTIINSDYTNTKLYTKAISNFIYIKNLNKNNNKENKNNTNNKNEDKNQDLNLDFNKNNQILQNNINKKLSYLEFDYILNLIEEEEKKYIIKKYKTTNIINYPKYEW